MANARWRGRHERDENSVRHPQALAPVHPECFSRLHLPRMDPEPSPRTSWIPRPSPCTPAFA